MKLLTRENFLELTMLINSHYSEQAIVDYFNKQGYRTIKGKLLTISNLHWFKISMNFKHRRDPKEDVPRRIYRSTIKRIDRYLVSKGKDSKHSKKKIKYNFNKFLIEVMDVYEASRKGEINV